MADATLVRFVDEQRAEARWLIDRFDGLTDTASLIEKKALKTALVRAIHNALTGYYAELTQKRYAPDRWFAMLGGAGSFRAMARVAPCEAHVIARWLNLEADGGSCLRVALSAVGRIGLPEAPQYRSSLLSDTSLTVATQASPAMIASSAGEQPPSVPELVEAWCELEALMVAERNQGLEC
ncbi:MAG TPA: hypothetical protein VIC26_16800 [Marinagarivorans sp.]